MSYIGLLFKFFLEANNLLQLLSKFTSILNEHSLEIENGDLLISCYIERSNNIQSKPLLAARCCSI